MPHGPSQNAQSPKEEGGLGTSPEEQRRRCRYCSSASAPLVFASRAEHFVAPPLCWAELGYLPYLPDTKEALRLPLLRLATGLLFAQRTPKHPREPIITNADEFAMNFEGVCIPFSTFLRAGDLRREPMS
jgi:hypothetical protein